ncbi:hypothetical protein HK104_006790 [Borealophlyctis nickersoniae]|nr:hypothetical protein HK104_006790 [Borealophlyctis nickersoniae]
MAGRGGDLDTWVGERLSSLLGFGFEELQQMVPYLMSLQSQTETAEYLTGMLGDEPSAIEFIQEFNTRRFPAVNTQGSWQAPLKVSEQDKTAKQWKDQRNIYKKSEAEEYFVGGGKKVQKKNGWTEVSTPAADPPPRQNTRGGPPQQQNSSLLSDRLGSPNVSAPASPKNKQKKGGKKTKAEMAAALAEIEGMVKVGNAPPGFGGRLVCECLAAKHGLLTNCITCGKIICRLEGEGPCPCCGAQVSSKEQQMRVVQERKRKGPSQVKDALAGRRYGAAAGSMASAAMMPNPSSDAQFPELLSEEDREALALAEAQKERLLDFQRNSAARTRVHDTASDFDYDSDVRNKWLTAEERALALKKAHEQRRIEEEQKRRRVISIDLVNKRVIDATPPPPSKARDEEAKPPRPPSPPPDPGSSGQFRNPYLNAPAPVFVPVKPTTIENKTKIPIQRRKAEERKLKENDGAVSSRPVDPPVAKTDGGTKAKKGASGPKGKFAGERKALRRLQHDYTGFEGAAVTHPGGLGDFEVDEYWAEGGGGYSDEPACG